MFLLISDKRLFASNYLKQKTEIYEKLKKSKVKADQKVKAGEDVNRAAKLCQSNEDFIKYLDGQFLSSSAFFGYTNWGYDSEDQDRTNNLCESINHAFSKATSKQLKSYVKGYTAVYNFLGSYIARPVSQVIFSHWNHWITLIIKRLQFRRAERSQFIDERSENIANFEKLSKRKQKQRLICHMRELRPVLHIEPSSETISESDLQDK